MKAQSLEELNCNFSFLGQKLRKQIDKTILSKGGAWATIAFTYQEREKMGKGFGKPKIMIATFKNDMGTYKRQSYVIIKDGEIAESICNLLQTTFRRE
jgi:hypothetical protein